MASRLFCFGTSLGIAIGAFPLAALDFTVIRVENRADRGRYQVHAAAAHRSSMVEDWACRGRVRG